VDTVQVVERLDAPLATLSGGTLSCDPERPLVLWVLGLSPATATVQWSGGVVAGSDSLVVTLPGNYHAVVRHPVSGCEVTLTAEVVANPNCAVAEGCDEAPATGWDIIT
jgi:hypothetical protein